MRPLLVLEAMRPRQWTKNLFCLAGLAFGRQLGESARVADALLVTVAFCLASGATYLVNDVRDAETDRLNPRTAGRPIARGDLSPRTAVQAAVLAGALALGLGLAADPKAALVLCGFGVLQAAYTGGLKHVLFVDVLAIALGYVLRVLAGTTAVDVVASPWILLCTGLLAVFVGLTKRRGEATALGGERSPQRPVLDHYSVGLLDELIGVVTPSTLVAYALYTVEGAATDWMLATVPFVLYGIFRMLYLIHHQPHATEEPDVLVIRDRPLLICTVLWAIASALIVGLS